MQPVTETQRRVLDFMLTYQRDHGYGPTHREVCRRFGWSSTGTVHRHLARLRAKGLVLTDRWAKRGTVAATSTDAEKRLAELLRLALIVIEPGCEGEDCAGSCGSSRCELIGQIREELGEEFDRAVLLPRASAAMLQRRAYPSRRQAES